MIHVTVVITDFIMSLIWAGVWATAWAVGGLALVAFVVGGFVVGLRSVWRRHRSGR